MYTDFINYNNLFVQYQLWKSKSKELNHSYFCCLPLKEPLPKKLCIYCTIFQDVLKLIIWVLSTCILILTSKIDARNLSTIFGGMVDIISNTMSGADKTKLCCIMIENYHSIFNDIDKLKRRNQISGPSKEDNSKPYSIS